MNQVFSKSASWTSAMHKEPYLLWQRVTGPPFQTGTGHENKQFVSPGEICIKEQSDNVHGNSLHLFYLAALRAKGIK